MAEIKRDFTPDKQAGLEKASAALARVLDFTLQNKIQQDRQQKALEQVKFLQQKEDERHREKMAFDLKKLNDELAQDKFEFDEEMKHNRDQLAAMSREADLTAKNEHLKRMQKLINERHRLEEAKIRATVANSKASETNRRIQDSKVLFPAETFEDAGIEAGNVNDPTVTPDVYFREAMRLRNLRAEYIETGIIPSEFGPARTGFRTGSELPGLKQPQRLTPQENLLPFNFIDQSGNFSATPQQQAQPQTKEKQRKKVDF
jgi:hypothetical protein